MSTASAQMPQDLAQVHDALWQDVANLHVMWNVFNNLYGSKEAVELLNFAAPDYFGMSQAVWVDHILMAIARLTDPTRSAGNENLCLGRLLLHIDPSQSPGLHARIQAELQALASLTSPIRERRMKLLAHADLDLRFARASTLLAPVTNATIEAAFEKIRDIMNDVQSSYTGATTFYRFAGESDGQGLLSCLEKARQYERQERARLGLPPDPAEHEA